MLVEVLEVVSLLIVPTPQDWCTAWYASDGAAISRFLIHLLFIFLPCNRRLLHTFAFSSCCNLIQLCLCRTVETSAKTLVTKPLWLLSVRHKELAIFYEVFSSPLPVFSTFLMTRFTLEAEERSRTPL